MSAAEKIAETDVAVRDMLAEVQRADTLYRNSPTDAAWSAVKAAREAHKRAELSAKHAREAAVREEKNAADAKRRAQLDELAAESKCVDQAWPVIVDISDEIAKHARAIVELSQRAEKIVELAQDAASSAKYIASELGTHPQFGRVPTVQFARALVRARLADLPPDVAARWVASGVPYWQDPTRAIFDDALATLGLSKPSAPPCSDGAPLGWAQSIEYQRAHDEHALHEAARKS
ncbi:MAG TPA: hypothetical protein VGH28_26850 [Polyangiaceae bacterium]|jgi:hypothetical protein